MKRLQIPILLATLLLIFYASIPGLGVTLNLMFFLFSLSPLIVIGLVIWVLKKGVPSDRTWEEGYFYEDANFVHKTQHQGRPLTDEIHDNN
jgi:hypothetical protein